jgi:hypothetical protein
MSGRLVSCVFESRLPHRLKSLAAVLATFGHDDGTSIRPSVDRVARLWGRSKRRALAALADLQALGVLVVVRPHAPHRPTEYRLDLTRLAALPRPPAAQARHQLVLPLFPQVFPQAIGQLARESGDFHSFHRRTGDDSGATGDASVTRSVKKILRATSTSTRARETTIGTRLRKAHR